MPHILEIHLFNNMSYPTAYLPIQEISIANEYNLILIQAPGYDFWQASISIMATLFAISFASQIVCWHAPAHVCRYSFNTLDSRARVWLASAIGVLPKKKKRHNSPELCAMFFYFFRYNATIWRRLNSDINALLQFTWSQVTLKRKNGMN